jgi:nucleoside-diphosphate-sugar epimerase
MNILIFGASGYIGKHVASRLIADGHHVTAFVRSERSAQIVRSLGADALIGSLDEVQGPLAALDDHDAVIWAAQLMLEQERDLTSAMLERLQSTGKAFIFTSGTSLLSERTDGDWTEKNYGEDDAFVPRRQIAPRLDTENMVRGAAAKGVRAMCIRPPLVWGHGGSRVISDLYHSARKTGSVCYVGRGLNVYSSVHVEDLARLYSLAIERGVAGALYHGVSGELNYRSMAEAIARHLGIASRGVTVAEAVEIWDKFTGGIVLCSCSRTRSPRARAELGWAPSPAHLDILEDCVHPSYASEGERSLPPWVRAGSAS